MEPKSKRASRFDVRRANVTACNRCKAGNNAVISGCPCSNCDRAGVECVGYDTVAGRLAPRRRPCGVSGAKINIKSNPLDDIPESQNIITDHGEDEAVITRRQSEETRPNSARVQPRTQTQIQPRRSTATSFPPLMYEASETWLIGFLLKDLGLDIQSTDWSFTNSPGPHGSMKKMFPIAALDTKFDVDVANKLASVYFEHCDSFLLVLHRQQFYSDLAAVHERASLAVSEGAEHRYFRYFMVMAIALLLMMKTDASTPWNTSERVLASALAIISEQPRKILSFDIDHLEAITLLAQYASLHPRSTGASHTIGLAVRLSIDLGFHNEASLQPTTNFLETERRRRLFWAIYSLEINMCIALERPPAIPDECITTEYPARTDDIHITENGINQQESSSMKLSAIWVLNVRRLEYEIQARLHYAPPRGYAPLKISEWRENMALRLHALYDNRPCTLMETKLAPTDIFGGFLSTTLVYLMMPTKQYPTVAASDAIFLAKNAIRAINIYRDSFRSGTLRFYWRATSRLFHCGSALLYCIRHVADLENSIATSETQSAIHTCSAVLWGMAERYSPGKSYRDLFDQMTQSINSSTLDNTTQIYSQSNQISDNISNPFSIPVTPLPIQTSGYVAESEFEDIPFLFGASEDGPLRYIGIFS